MLKKTGNDNNKKDFHYQVLTHCRLLFADAWCCALWWIYTDILKKYLVSFSGGNALLQNPDTFTQVSCLHNSATQQDHCEQLIQLLSHI
jgi:hypothetical protein